MRRRRSTTAAAGVLVALLAVASASASVRPGTYSAVEYRKGHPTDFLDMKLTVSHSGRAVTKVSGTVHAECNPARPGGSFYFQDFDFSFASVKPLTRAGKLDARYVADVSTSGATVHQTLKLTGSFHGSKITGGTIDFQSAVKGQGPGCSFKGDWRGTRKS